MNGTKIIDKNVKSRYDKMIESEYLPSEVTLLPIISKKSVLYKDLRERGYSPSDIVKFRTIADLKEAAARRHPIANIINYLYIKDKNNFLTITSKITFFLFYPVRLIVILIIWSIRTIKE